MTKAGQVRTPGVGKAGGARVAAFLLGSVLASPVGAGDLFSSSNGNALFREKLRVLDTRAAQQYAYSDRLRPKPAGEPVPAYGGSYRGAYLALARAAARHHGVPEDLFARLVTQESGWDPRAVSPRGAQGLAQLMPATARKLGVTDAFDPEQNLDGGARYLRAQYERFGSWRLALAAYNAGPEAVERHAGVPPFAETQGYVTAIMGG